MLLQCADALWIKRTADLRLFNWHVLMNIIKIFRRQAGYKILNIQQHIEFTNLLKLFQFRIVGLHPETIKNGPVKIHACIESRIVYIVVLHNCTSIGRDLLHAVQSLTVGGIKAYCRQKPALPIVRLLSAIFARSYLFWSDNLLKPCCGYIVSGWNFAAKKTIKGLKPKSTFLCSYPFAESVIC